MLFDVMSGNVTESLQEQFALYADRFPVWAQQTSAMHQYAMWTELRTLNVGANLQHYNPLVDEDAAGRGERFVNAWLSPAGDTGVYVWWLGANADDDDVPDEALGKLLEAAVVA